MNTAGHSDELYNDVIEIYFYFESIEQSFSIKPIKKKRIVQNNIPRK